MYFICWKNSNIMKNILGICLLIFSISCTVFKSENDIVPREEEKIDSTWAKKYKLNSIVDTNDESLLVDIYLKDGSEKIVLDFKNLVSFKTSVMSYKNKMCKTELYINAKNIKPFLNKHRKILQGVYGNDADIGLMILSGNSRPLGNIGFSFFENREAINSFNFIDVVKFDKEYIHLSEVCNYQYGVNSLCNDSIVSFYAEIIDDMKIPLKFGIFIFTNYSKKEGFYSSQKEIVFEPKKL